MYYQRSFAIIDVVEGVPTKVSVTQLVAKFFSKFDADDIIMKMMSGKKWPRKEYQHPNGNAYTAAEIKKKWDNIALNGKNRGSWMHHNIERRLNGLSFAEDLEEFKQFSVFHNDVLVKSNLVPYRTEWRIGGGGLAGTIDFVAKYPDGKYVLFDWKRLKDVDAALSNNYGIRAL